MDPYLAGTAPEFAAQNLTDLILGRPKQGGTVVTTIVPKLQQTARKALGSLKGRGRGARPAHRRHPRDVLDARVRPEHFLSSGDDRFQMSGRRGLG